MRAFCRLRLFSFGGAFLILAFPFGGGRFPYPCLPLRGRCRRQPTEEVKSRQFLSRRFAPLSPKGKASGASLSLTPRRGKQAARHSSCLPLRGRCRRQPTEEVKSRQFLSRRFAPLSPKGKASGASLSLASRREKQAAHRRYPWLPERESKRLVVLLAFPFGEGGQSLGFGRKRSCPLSPRFRRVIRLSPSSSCRLPHRPHRPQRYRRYPPRFAAAISDTPRWRAA